jgi:hypothetical protein
MGLPKILPHGLGDKNDGAKGHHFEELRCATLGTTRLDVPVAGAVTDTWAAAVAGATLRLLSRCLRPVLPQHGSTGTMIFAPRVPVLAAVLRSSSCATMEGVFGSMNWVHLGRSTAVSMTIIEGFSFGQPLAGKQRRVKNWSSVS